MEKEKIYVGVCVFYVPDDLFARRESAAGITSVSRAHVLLLTSL